MNFWLLAFGVWAAEQIEVSFTPAGCGSCGDVGTLNEAVLCVNEETAGGGCMATSTFRTWWLCGSSTNRVGEMEGVMFPHSNANYQIESVELSVIRLADETLPVPDEQVHRDALMDAARKCMAGSELVLMENGKCVMTGFTLRVPGVAYSIHDQMVDDVYEAVIKATFADPPLLEAQTFVFSNDGVACSDIVDFKVEGIARAHPVAAVTRDGALNSHTKSLGVAALLLALAP